MLRDDIVEYSLEGHHAEEAGKKIRKKIWKVTAILTVITAVEVALDLRLSKRSDYWQVIKWLFIGLTIVKAAYIVLVFMHLGEERKGLKYVILIPYFIFIIYLIFILLWEGMAVGDIWAVSAS